MVRGIRTHDQTRITLKYYPLYYKGLFEWMHWAFQNLKFSGQKKTEKLVIFKKNYYPKYCQYSLNI